MTACGAVISLQNTIKYILSCSRFSLVGRSRQIMRVAYKELQPWKQILKRLDSTSTSRSRKKVNALDRRIKDLIWEFEDLLESLLTDQIVSQIPAHQVDEEMKERVWESLPSQPQIPPQQVESTTRTRTLLSSALDFLRRKFNTLRIQSKKRDALVFSIDLQRLKNEVRSLIKTLKEMKKEYIYEVDNMDEDDEAAPSTVGFVGTNQKMIGLSDVFENVKQFMNSYLHSTEHQITLNGVRVRQKVMHALFGTAGVGKTTLAMEIYEDPEILSKYECRAWVTLGRKPLPTSQISRGILAQLCGVTLTQGDEIIGDYLKERLKGKNCLIVLDDVWEGQVLDSLVRSLPDIQNGIIQILVTARHDFRSSMDSFSYNIVRFLNEKESMDLLCHKVFGEDIFPPQLDKAATKIAKKCEGLPLMIITVAAILSKSQNRDDPDYWDEVAEDRNSVFTDAYNEISKVLFPSYDYLPQYLKMPFLFMGVFPLYYDNSLYKIINMLTAEGWFLHTNRKKTLEESVWKCLFELDWSYHLVLVSYKRTPYSGYPSEELLFGCTYKTCRLHSSWRYVCRREASKNKFYHVLNKLIDAEEGVKGQRGLCLENNILFGIKQFCNTLRLNCASSTRSLLFYGPYQQYPVPIDVGFRLLREIDALTQRFYTFPTEILTLAQLKCLALTCNGELPTTISKLFNLQVLIIHPHSNIRYCRAPSYVPIQIWDMQELEHIEILGKILVAPYHVASLKKLSTLVGVNADIGTILKLSRRIPNIRKLVLHIELMPYDDHNDLLGCFVCISKLGSLETLKCSIINPVLKYGYVVPTTPSSLKLPRGLKKLHLSGMGFPWEYMDAIGSLPHLEVLKLRSYAFRGSKWEAREGSFTSLEFLLIEDSDLVQWKPRSGSFRKLNYLSMKHCYKLEEIQWPSYHFFGHIELMDCKPLALTCAEQLQPRPRTVVHVTASYFFDEKPTTIKFRRGSLSTEEEHEEENDDEDLADSKKDDEEEC